jgi:hypothetical protein
MRRSDFAPGTLSRKILPAGIMNRPDRIDTTLAKHFAWSFARAGVVADPEERLRAARGPAAPAPPAAPAARTSLDDDLAEAARLRARRACRPLGVAVERAWDMGDDDEGARAAKRLLVRAERLDHVLAGFDERPALAVRMLRLFVRHSSKMSPHQRERAAQIATLLPLDDPEAADLLVEVARAGDREMARALLADEDWAPEVGDPQDLAARLADVIEAGPTHAARVVAIDMLPFAGDVARSMTVPVLRAALRLPSASVRGHALLALLAVEPCPVAAADVASLIRDLVLHALPQTLGDEEREEDERLLADALLVAIAQVRPAEAEESLLDFIDAEHDALWLDAGWATEALAVAFPRTAAAMVDYWLSSARGALRVRALGALARLPDELAQPRLLVAASDPAFVVRDTARRQWLERFARPCPSGPSDLVGAALMARPPSEAFVSRLAVMQGRVRAARLSMARALLAEAPDPEALVLLLQLVGDDSDSLEPTFAPGGGESWASLLVTRFGAAGVQGLCALAERFHEPETFGWMRRLGDLLEQGVIGKERGGPLRDLASRQVATPERGRVDDAVRVLVLVGAGPDLLEPVLALALDDDRAPSCTRDLLVSWPDRALDARLESVMEQDLALARWGRFERAAAVALRRGGRRALDLGREAIALAEHSEAAVDAAAECARCLRERGGLGDGWALSAVAHPESPQFAVAVRAWGGCPLLRAGLEGALGSKARGGASAVEAAVVLLHGEPALDPRDKRLARLLEKASPEGRARLVAALSSRGVPFSVIRPYLEALFVSSDPAVTRAMVGVAATLKSPRTRAWLDGLLPRIVDSELAADVEEALGGPRDGFWQEG